MDKAHPLIVCPDIGPVNIQNVNGVFRHPDLPKHLIKRIFRHPKEVRILLHKQAFVNIGEPVFIHTVEHMIIEVIICCTAFLRQVNESTHGFLAPWDRFFHCLDKCFHSARQAKIKMLSAAGRSDTSVKLRYKTPIDVQLILFHQQLPGHRPVSGRSERTEFMQRSIEFEPPPNEACRAAARHIVLFQKKDFFSCRSKTQCSRQAACPRAYDDSIKFAHLRITPFCKLSF